jgi:excisionase family DNA binding protein
MKSHRVQGEPVDPLLSLNEAAAFLRICPATLKRLSDKNKIPGASRFGRKTKFNKEILMNWLMGAFQENV